MDLKTISAEVKTKYNPSTLFTIATWNISKIMVSSKFSQENAGCLWSGVKLPSALSQPLLDEVLSSDSCGTALFNFTADHVHLFQLDLSNKILSINDIHHLSQSPYRKLLLNHLMISDRNPHNAVSLLNIFARGSPEQLIEIGLARLRVPSSSTNFKLTRAISRFCNLAVLDISSTSIVAKNLKEIVAVLPNLRSLDISRTKVQCIDFLPTYCRELTSLCFCAFRCRPGELIGAAMRLQRLQVLKLCSYPSDDEPVRELNDMCSRCVWPDLLHIDLGFNPLNMSISDLKSFLNHHPLLQYIGIGCWACSSTDYSISTQKRFQLQSAIQAHPNPELEWIFCHSESPMRKSSSYVT